VNTSLKPDIILVDPVHGYTILVHNNDGFTMRDGSLRTKFVLFVIGGVEIDVDNRWMLLSDGWATVMEGMFRTS
jgi:hypothetical protein